MTDKDFINIIYGLLGITNEFTRTAWMRSQYSSIAKMDSMELWTSKPAGDVCGQDATVEWKVARSGVAVIRLDPDCAATTNCTANAK